MEHGGCIERGFERLALPLWPGRQDEFGGHGRLGTSIALGRLEALEELFDNSHWSGQLWAMALQVASTIAGMPLVTINTVGRCAPFSRKPG